MAKEHELESIGQQAAAAAHSLGTPLSTITVIARELKKEIKNDPKYSKDIDLLLSQAKRCSDILKNISKNQIVVFCLYVVVGLFHSPTYRCQETVQGTYLR